MYLVELQGFLEEDMEDFLALFGLGGLARSATVWEGGA